ncbi:hypothetical protein [Streptomyces mirabilis]|nr:hypothetical protein [Streptomyces mirabilis]
MDVRECLSQLDCQQVQFARRPLAPVQNALCLLNEFTGQAELG